MTLSENVILYIIQKTLMYSRTHIQFLDTNPNILILCLDLGFVEGEENGKGR